MNFLRWIKSSRKAALALAGILVTLVLLGTGQVDGETAAQTIGGLLMILITGIALEDAAEKHGRDRDGD